MVRETLTREGPGPEETTAKISLSKWGGADVGR